MTYVANPCTHCSNGCKTTLSVRNNEILRANNRDQSGINGEFLCAKGRFAFDFTKHPERVRVPLIRRNGKLEPAGWEDAFEEVTRRLKQIHEKHGGSAIGVIGSNHTTNEENYLLNRFARLNLGTNNLDHHRTADYAGLAAALGPNAADSLATMADVYEASTVVVIGNDPTQQNPLVAWQIRTGIRHHNSKLYLINSQPSKLERKATQFIQLPPDAASGTDAEAAAINWLASGQGNFAPEVSDGLVKLRTALESSSDVVIVFGAAINGAAVWDLVAFGSRLSGRTRYMALGDYANSRGAADFGVLPDRLPGYASLADADERARFSKLWGAEIPSAPGLTARQMIEAATSGKLRALYVVGANPVKTFAAAATTGTAAKGTATAAAAKSGNDRLGALDFLVVQDLFLTETAKLADVVLPAASTYEKDGTMTATSGEVQITHRSIDAQGPRSDFDLLRIISHQLSQLSMGPAIRLRTPEAAFDEIRQNVAGYKVSFANLLSGSAERVTASAKQAVMQADDASAAAPGTIFSSQDFLFSSGTLGRYCSKLKSCSEAKEIPWSSSPSTQSWWYR
jgi:NADH-quinone oxidoreductase subunit G